MRPGAVDGASCDGHSASPTGPLAEQARQLVGVSVQPTPINHTPVILLREAILEVPFARRLTPWQVPLSCLIPKHVSTWTFAEA
jgi:hypothetical protein